MSASVNLPLHHKVQKFFSGTGSPGGPRKRAVKWLCVCVCDNSGCNANCICRRFVDGGEVEGKHFDT